MFQNNKISHKYIKKAFTFVEVIIATFISSIVLVFLFAFLTNIVDGISDTNSEVRILSSFYDFNNRLNNYRNIYITGSILIETSTGSDIFLMQDFAGENGMLFGPVSIFDEKLNNNNTSYEEKGVGFRRISATELADIAFDKEIIYTYIFQKDNIYPELKIQDMFLSSYNNGSIFDLTLIVDSNFNYGLLGSSRNDLPKDTLKKLNINF